MCVAIVKNRIHCIFLLHIYYLCYLVIFSYFSMIKCISMIKMYLKMIKMYLCSLVTEKPLEGVAIKYVCMYVNENVLLQC